MLANPGREEESTKQEPWRRDLEQIKADLGRHRAELQRLEEDVRPSVSAPTEEDTEGEAQGGPGWSVYQGVWTPKPIGDV